MRPPALVLAAAERRTLRRMADRPTSPQRAALRARILPQVAAGVSRRAVARRLGRRPRTVRKWVGRMARDRMAGLRDAPRSGRPRRITPTERCRVIAAACTTPADVGLAGYTTWSGSLLAETVVRDGRVAAISGRAAHRILQTADLEPHGCASWKRRTDAHFDTTMRAILPPYLGPPPDGMVWSIDENTSIQALARRFPALPLRRPEGRIKRECEYVRHGTRFLTAGLEVHTG